MHENFVHLFLLEFKVELIFPFYANFKTLVKHNIKTIIPNAMR